MGEPGQQSSLHTFRGFHRRGCAGSGWRGQRRAGKRHVSLSFGLMRYDFENCEFSTTTFQRAKTKSQKIPERAIVAALMPGAPFRAFNGYRPVFSIVPPPVRQLTATTASYSAKAKKWKGEQGSKIILNRLKSYIEYMANLGGSPVVCTGGSSNCEKRFKCKVSYRKRERKGESKRCIFNFTAKWDKHGYYIHLLSESRRYCNNGCA